MVMLGLYNIQQISSKDPKTLCKHSSRKSQNTLGLIIFPMYQWLKRGTRKISDWPRLTQLVWRWHLYSILLFIFISTSALLSLPWTRSLCSFWYLLSPHILVKALLLCRYLDQRINFPPLLSKTVLWEWSHCFIFISCLIICFTWQVSQRRPSGRSLVG